MGFDVMPNYVDSSATNLTVSPSCSCRGSGNLEEECQRFLRDFTGNPCLRNAIQAFGNGTDVPNKVRPAPHVTVPPTVEKSPPSTNDISNGNTIYMPMITTCTSVQVLGPCNAGAPGHNKVLSTSPLERTPLLSQEVHGLSTPSHLPPPKRLFLLLSLQEQGPKLNQSKDRSLCIPELSTLASDRCQEACQQCSGFNLAEAEALNLTL
ncbi:hypothetical protein lerEdw1_019851 [Lerista edwardsae]|nr:hypothetical protein lerEdw1_019851 [Lerista edwardsae]